METRNIEYKESWRDEYLKWICGFANAQGGTMFIGVNDEGNVVGVKDAKKLMEDIPNMVRDVLGVVVEVDLHDKDGKQYIEIKTEAYPYPANYKGQYHFRSGNTKQELKGAALDRFMLRKQGKTWDSVPVPYLFERDLDKSELERFRLLVKRKKRMTDMDINVDDHSLLEKLRLFEGTYLKRSAALLFAPDPERYIAGAYIKIGMFGKNDAELLYQDEVHGPLFKQIAVLTDLLMTKYMKAWIRYEGLQRIESYPVIQEVLREALLNAIVHKDYSQSVPIQISVYDNKLMIWNCGILPENWTVETLAQKHGSFPFNPEIANAFFRAGEIESWGRGIEQMTLLNQQNGFPKPLFKYDGVGLWTILEYPQNTESDQAVAQHKPFNYERFAKELGQVCPSLPKLNKEEYYGLFKVMQLCKDGATVSAMTGAMNDLSRRTFVRNFLKPLLDAGLLEMQYPERPNHPKQKYLLTPKGKAVLEKAKPE